MRLTLEQILGFFVEFERALTQLTHEPVFSKCPRQVAEIVALFANHANCTFTIEEADFDDISCLTEEEKSYIRDLDRSGLASIALNFGSYAKIILNGQKKPDGSRLLNFCYTRFFSLKEAFHIVIRDEFSRWGIKHPDGNSPAILSSSIEELIFLPFSILTVS